LKDIMAEQQKKVIGLKQMTKAHSKPVKLAKGGKELIRDNSKHRKYKVVGE
jgi:hypothetical protein